jgi:protein-disulfide isomerase
MLKSFRFVSAAYALLLVAALSTVGCRAQVPPPGSAETLSPEMARRIAVTIRSKAQLPFNYDVKVDERKPSSFTGYDEVTVTLGEHGKPQHSMKFLLSKDGNTLAQMNTFDLPKDMLAVVTAGDRPSRGGSAKAPVTVVVFDDLECPFCARMHAQMFPALTARYGDKVHVVYKDFPLANIHPWAVHAAVDADCLAAQSHPGYWNLVDYLHAHVDEMGLDPAAHVEPGKEPQKTLPVAMKQLDTQTLAEGARQKVDTAKLTACVNKQDETTVRVSMHEGDGLGVNGVPAIYINGEPIVGAIPIEFVFRAVDDALVAQGVKPPPPVPLPLMDAPVESSPASAPTGGAPTSTDAPAGASPASK